MCNVLLLSLLSRYKWNRCYNKLCLIKILEIVCYHWDTVLFKIILFKKGVLIYAEHCWFLYILIYYAFYLTRLVLLRSKISLTTETCTSKSHIQTNNHKNTHSFGQIESQQLTYHVYFWKPQNPERIHASTKRTHNIKAPAGIWTRDLLVVSTNHQVTVQCHLRDQKLAVSSLLSL